MEQNERKKQITVIPATGKKQKTEIQKNKLQVAAYCRVSTEMEEQQNSFYTQVQYYTNYIEKIDGWELYRIYADEGISGTSTRKRIQFNRMIEDAKAGKIDRILTKSISRFARNTLDTLRCVRELKSLNPPVGVWFEKENIDTLDSRGELMLTILSALAQDESRSTSDNIRWAIQKKFQQGVDVTNLNTMLGYEFDENREWKINPEQAQTVRYIYKKYLEGFSMAAIADMLTKEGRKTGRGGSVWRSGAIMKILANEKYTGDSMLQKTIKKDLFTHQSILNHGSMPRYYIQDHHPAIISRDIWEEVQQERKRRKQKEQSWQMDQVRDKKRFQTDENPDNSEIQKEQEAEDRCLDAEKQKERTGMEPCENVEMSGLIEVSGLSENGYQTSSEDSAITTKKIEKYSGIWPLSGKIRCGCCHRLLIRRSYRIASTGQEIRSYPVWRCMEAEKRKKDRICEAGSYLEFTIYQSFMAYMYQLREELIVKNKRVSETAEESGNYGFLGKLWDYRRCGIVQDFVAEMQKQKKKAICIPAGISTVKETIEHEQNRIKVVDSEKTINSKNMVNSENTENNNRISLQNQKNDTIKIKYYIKELTRFIKAVTELPEHETEELYYVSESIIREFVGEILTSGDELLFWMKFGLIFRTGENRRRFRSFFGKYAYQNDRNGISQKICIHSASVLLQCIQMPDWRNHKS